MPSLVCGGSLRRSSLLTPLSFQSLELGLRQGFVDTSLKVVCYTDHQIFERYHRYRSKEKFSKSKALTLRELQTLQPGDFVTHIDYGIAKFAGLEKKEVNGHEQEAIRLVYKDDDMLYVSIHSLHKISKYSGREGTPPAISKLGTQEWEIKKSKVKKRVKDIAKELIELYAKRKSASGHAFSLDGYLQAELETSFMYEDTPDQAKATESVKQDMEAPHPMDRLVCGDVGLVKRKLRSVQHLKLLLTESKLQFLCRLPYWLCSIFEHSMNDSQIFQSKLIIYRVSKPPKKLRKFLNQLRKEK
jgi:transcription-repair coupling factor (superfamily II helicase)